MTRLLWAILCTVFATSGFIQADEKDDLVLKARKANTAAINSVKNIDAEVKIAYDPKSSLSIYAPVSYKYTRIGKNSLCIKDTMNSGVKEVLDHRDRTYVIDGISYSHLQQRQPGLANNENHTLSIGNIVDGAFYGDIVFHHAQDVRSNGRNAFTFDELFQFDCQVDNVAWVLENNKRFLKISVDVNCTRFEFYFDEQRDYLISKSIYMPPAISHPTQISPAEMSPAVEYPNFKIVREVIEWKTYSGSIHLPVKIKEEIFTDTMKEKFTHTYLVNVISINKNLAENDVIKIELPRNISCVNNITSETYEVDTSGKQVGPSTKMETSSLNNEELYGSTIARLKTAASARDHPLHAGLKTDEDTNKPFDFTILYFVALAVVIMLVLHYFFTHSKKPNAKTKK